jgi:RNA-directed DNA polymerase
MNQSLLEKIASDSTFYAAYQWLCKARNDSHHNHDVWHLRFHRQRILPQIQAELREGRFRFEPVQRVLSPTGLFWIWAARDALVLKATAMVLGEYLSKCLSSHCYHLAGRGGAKAAVRAVQGAIAGATFIFRSDVKGYYASINHECLKAQLSEMIPEPAVIELLQGYLQHLVDEDGYLRTIQQGISLGCPISPLMGAVYLKPLDDALTHAGWFYARFMDDWVVLVPTRGKLRQAIKRANAVLEGLKVEKHPDKTYIGRVAHGFDFLGYQFDLQASRGLIITAKTLNNHRERLRELAMQGADAEQMANYRKHWVRWVQSGVTLREDEMGEPVAAENFER